MTREKGSSPKKEILSRQDVKNKKRTSSGQTDGESRKSEERYQKAQKVGHIGNWEYDLKTQHFWGSDEAKRIYGFDPGKSDFTTDEVENCIPEKDRVHQALIDLIEKGKEYNLEFEIHPINSPEPRFIWSIAEVQRDEDGLPLIVTGVIQDITERKRADDKLKESELRYRSLFENMIEGFAHCRMIYDINGLPVDWVYLNVNTSFEKLTGLKDVIGKHVTEVIPGIAKTNPELFDIYGRVSMTGVPEQLETYLPILEIWLHLSVFSPGKDFFFVVFENISERKKAEEILRESEEKYRSIVENINDVLYTLDNQGNITYLSPVVEHLTQYKVADLIGKPFAPLIHPDDMPGLSESFNRLMSGQMEPWEFRIMDKDGTIKYVRTSSRPVYSDGRINGVTAVMSNITERKQAEEKLNESRESFRALLENAMDLITIMEADGTIKYESPSSRMVLGYEPYELMGKNALDYIHPDDLPKAASALSPEAATRDVVLIELRFRHKDGSWVNLEAIGKDLRDNPAIGGIVINSRDITERKKAEEELKTSRIRLAEAMDMAHLVNWEFDVKTSTFTFNDRFYALYGTTADREGGYHMTADVYSREFLHPDDQHLVTEEVIKAINATDPEYTSQVEHRIIRRDGEIRHIVVRFGITKNSEGRTLITHGANQDITERRQAEEERENLQVQLNQAQKMESVGRLAGGVAHDFNNMLSVILGHSELALMLANPEQPIFEDLQQIRKAAERSADLTRQLLAFARKQTVVPIVLDMNETVEGMLTMLRRLIGEDIDLAWVPAENLMPVKMDPSQIDQVLANLCINARDAIAGVGKVTIETGNATFNKSYCYDHPDFTPGDYVMLAVSDDGKGMDKETLANIFEPFFTTKDMGEGTGLGLSTVYGIVRQNNGYINVYSEPGHGTTFRIYLPGNLDNIGQFQTSDPSEPIEPGNETVLLVEDEPAILNMTMTMLQRLGYTGLAAPGPLEAMRLADNYLGEIHLLMTDVIMPDMNGRDLAATLLFHYPNIKCLFMSGYTANVIAHHGVLEDGVNFIQKPFSLNELAAKLRLVLDGKK